MDQSARSVRTTSSILFSWNKRMAATPAAPASRHDAAFSIVTPPRARTGIFARQASRKAARPAGGFRQSLFFRTPERTRRSRHPRIRRGRHRRQCGRRRRQEVVGGRWPVARELQHLAHFMRCDIVCPQMNSIGSRRQRNVGARVDEKTSSQFRFSVLSERCCARPLSVPCQHFQFSRAQIFFAELDVVDAGACSFGDLWRAGRGGGRSRRRETDFGR